MVLLLCYWLFFIYRPIYYICDRSYHVSSSSSSSNFKPVTSSHPLTFSHLFELPFTFTGTTGGTVAILFTHQKLPKISFTKDFQIILWARERCSQTNKLHPSYVRTYGPDRDDCNNTNCRALNSTLIYSFVMFTFLLLHNLSLFFATEVLKWTNFIIIDDQNPFVTIIKSSLQKNCVACGVSNTTTLYQLWYNITNLSNTADMNHRPSESLKNSKAYELHLKRTLQKACKLSFGFPGYLDFTEEMVLLEERLRCFDESKNVI